MEKILKFINKLPVKVREICYLIYLLIQLLSMIKTFFNPNKTNRVAPQFDGTHIPVETENGIVHKFMTDDEISKRYAHDNALELDPAYLASKGVEPRSFSGSVISPLDAHDRIVSNAFDSIFSVQSTETSSQTPTETSNETSSETSN